MERNILFTLAYCGTGYHGWQIQDNARTVQQVFQEALARIVGVCPPLKGCSRTDAGVHARQFCISMKIDTRIPNERLVGAMNHFLPPDMAVLSCRTVQDDLHARYSCLGKEYTYEIWNQPVRNPFLEGRALHYYGPLDVDKLNEAAQYYVGKHDFHSFCTLDARDEGDLTRTIQYANVRRREDGMVIFTVAADGFLYNMVRILTGTLLEVAQGKRTPQEIEHILKAKDRAAAGPTAPACGLYLNRVFYPDDIELDETKG